MKLRDIIAVPFWLVGGVFLYLAVRIGGTFTASMVARNERETLITKRNTNNLESTNQEYIDSKVKDFDLANSEVVEEYDNGKKVRKGLSPELLNSLRKTLQDVENHTREEIVDILPSPYDTSLFEEPTKEQLDAMHRYCAAVVATLTTK